MLLARLRDTPILRKLTRLALAAGLAFLAVAGLFVASWRSQEEVSARVNSTYIPMLRASAEAAVRLSSISTELFRYVNQVEPSAYRVREALAGALAALQRIDQPHAPEGVRRDIRAVLPLFGEFSARLARLDGYLKQDQVLEVNDAQTWLSAEAGTMLQVVERINDRLWDRIVEENESGAGQARRNALTALGLGLACMLGALLYLALVHRDLEGGLARLQESVRRYAEDARDPVAPLERRDEIGELSRFIAALSTKVNDSEQRLQAQLKFVNDVFESVPLSLALRDTEFRYRLVNRTWERYFGRRREEVLGRSLYEMAEAQGQARDVAEAAIAADRRALAADPSQPPEPAEMRFRDRYYLQTRSVLSDAEGRTTGVLVTGLDTTPQHQMRAALQIEQQRLDLVVRAARAGIIDNDLVAKSEWFSPRFKELLGHPPEFNLSETLFDLMHPEDRPRIYDAYIAHLKGTDPASRDSLTLEYRLRRVDGSWVWVHGMGMSLRDASGRALRFLASISDISERQQQEEALRASREAALQAAQAKAAFLAAMSHEIRTPLNGVLGMAGLLADTELSPEQRDYVETVRVSGDALLSVINDILDYSKIESGRMDLERAPLRPARAVEESIEILGERARGKRLDLVADFEDGVPDWVLGDLARLRQVLVNLVSNAVKFTERGEVLVKARAVAGATPMLEFSVSDTGIGIPAERLDALYQPFTQADASTTRKYGGTGLGLAISRRLVEMMGGKLTAQSAPGQGSTFSFSIPAHECAPPAGDPVDAAPVDLAGRRILIVDDNATNLRILRRQIERWGATPVAASSPRAALGLLQDGNFDAALLDYHMPEMDGVMLAREMKVQREALPLVLLSSSMYRRAEEAEAGLFVAQLLKPVRQQQLHEAIGYALTGRRAPAPRSARRRGNAPHGTARALSVLVVDDIEVNRRVAMLLLRKAGHVSEAVSSGAEALELVTAGRYDVVLMDLQMPDIDGLEAMQRIRERLGAAAPRVVAMTANALPGDRERCLAAGMDGYVAKPLDAAELAAQLRGVRTAAAAGVQKSAGDGGTPLVDVSRLQSLVEYDDDERSMVRGLIDAFLRDAPGYLASIQSASARGEHQAVMRAAHALKGAASNAGASAISSAAAAVESAARENPRNVPGLVVPLQATLERTASALQGLRSTLLK